MWTRTASLALVVMVVAGGCTGDDGQQATPTPSTFPPGTLTPPDGDEIDCGEYTLPNDPASEEIPDDDLFPDEHQCFIDAVTEGTPAVLVEHSMTTEGDPVRQQMRVTGPNTFDLTHDDTGAFGGGNVPVYTVACTGARVEQSRLSAVECEDPPE